MPWYLGHDEVVYTAASDDQTVRLWNPHTSQEVQAFEGPPGITTVGFAFSDTALLTDRGTISITDISISHSNFEPLAEKFIPMEQAWIQQGDYDFLWLPQEFRSDRSTFYGNTTAIGLSSGQVRKLNNYVTTMNTRVETRRSSPSINIEYVRSQRIGEILRRLRNVR